MSNPNEYIGGGEVVRSASVDNLMAIFEPWMTDPGVTEIAVNRPDEVWIERASVWSRHALPAVTYNHMEALGVAVSRFSGGMQDYGDLDPILSSILPGNQRVQFVRPPACELGTVSMTIRKPSHEVRRLEDYADQGFFRHVRPVSNELTQDERGLVDMHVGGDYMGFLRRAVQLQKVIIVAGETGSGKTTFMKALMQEMPVTDRVVTIEDVPELFLPSHPNHVHLFYPSERKADGVAVTPATLLKSSLRMKPTRILLAELRGAETLDFVNAAASGHGGSITSCHAGSPELTFDRLALMIAQNPEAQKLDYAVIRRLLDLVVDVVVHVHNDTAAGGIGRHITGLWYQPQRKYALLQSA